MTHVNSYLCDSRAYRVWGFVVAEISGRTGGKTLRKTVFRGALRAARRVMSHSPHEHCAVFSWSCDSGSPETLPRFTGRTHGWTQGSRGLRSHRFPTWPLLFKRLINGAGARRDGPHRESFVQESSIRNGGFFRTNPVILPEFQTGSGSMGESGNGKNKGTDVGSRNTIGAIGARAGRTRLSSRIRFCSGKAKAISGERRHGITPAYTPAPLRPPSA